jgi:hypothetical protein
MLGIELNCCWGHWRRAARTTAVALLLGAAATMPAIRAQSAADAGEAPLTLPSVPDERQTVAPPRVTAETVSGGTAGSSMAGVQNRAAIFSELSKAREDVRRAYIQQDYERVLALSQELRERFSVEETGSFYVVAAQLRLAERKEVEQGLSPFRRLSPRPPEMVGTVPSVEPAKDEAARTERVVASAPGGETTPSSAPGEVVEIPPGEGKLLPVGTVAPEASPETSPDGATDNPDETDEGDEPTGVSGGGGEITVAMAATPVAGRVEPSGGGVGEVADGLGSPALIEKLFLGIIVVGVLLLVGFIFIVMRRREEPEESLATTLGGVTMEPAQIEAPVRRSAEPAAETGHLNELMELDQAVIGEDEDEEEFFTAPSKPTGTTTERPKEAPQGDTTESSTGRGDVNALGDEMFKEILDQRESFANERRAATATGASGKAKTESPAAPEADELFMEGVTGAGKIAEGAKGASGGVEAPSAFDEPSMDDLLQESSINLNDLPDSPIGDRPWQATEPPVSLDLESDASGLPSIEFESPATPRKEPAPEAAETRGGFASGIEDGIEPSANPMAQTRTSWDESSAPPDEATVGQTVEIEDDLPSVGGMDSNRLQAFHADETVDLRQEEIDPEQTLESTQSAFAGRGGAVDEADVEDVGEVTMSSPSYLTTPPVEADAPESADAPGEERTNEGDLFDREWRIGIESYEQSNWAAAVHHLSVAAALRPDAMAVKEKLREARRQRRQQMES